MSPILIAQHPTARAIRARKAQRITRERARAETVRALCVLVAEYHARIAYSASERAWFRGPLDASREAFPRIA